MNSVWRPVTFLFFGFALIVLFQNCSSEVPFGQNDRFSDLVSSEHFPFEADLDQLAYMSCSEQANVSQDYQTFFSFRAGAYNTGGLRVTEAYKGEVVRLNDESVVSALTQNLQSTGTRLQLGLRTIDNLQLLYVNEDSGADGSNGIDYANLLTQFGEESFSSALWYNAPGARLNYWPGAQFAADYRMEGTLHYSASELTALDVRNFLSNRGIIALTFATEGEISPKGPGSFNGNTSSLTRDVYGMGLSMRFKQPSPLLGGSPGSMMPPRVLSNTTEVFIDKRRDGTIPTIWDCPDNMQFMIVLPDQAAGRCNTVPDPINPSARLKSIRQSLYAEDWYVDEVNKCIVPKAGRATAGSCYGINSSTQATHDVNYDTWPAGCGFGHDDGLCPHFASICVKL